jgi:hypothetical protein
MVLPGDPLAGVMDVSVGAGAVKVNGRELLVPPVFVIMTTFRGPGRPAMLVLNSAVTVVTSTICADVTLILVSISAPIRTLTPEVPAMPATKLFPLMVTGKLAPIGPVLGVMDVIAGGAGISSVNGTLLLLPLSVRTVSALGPGVARFPVPIVRMAVADVEL